MAKQAIDELAVIITANSTKLPGDLNKAKKDFEKFGKDVASMPSPPVKPPDMRPYQRAAREAAAARSQVRAAGESVLGFMGKVVATGGTIVAMEAGVTGVVGVFTQLKDAVNMAAELEQTRLGFEVMLGDARQANRLVADVRRYAASTPFNNRELISATRQLVAYGRSADTAMQDLKMLGDVSAAFGAGLPINDLVYLYGTLYAQQRAFTKDLYQFAGRGIPIWDELARVTGKTGTELRDMVEDGRIGFAEVEAAFKRMTAEGGRFYGMTARQGQTVAGVIEQMKDAFELLKIEVGQVLIEELGIKQGARDLEAFAGRLRDNVGTLRQAVKLVGDLAKGGAQVAYEFGRAGVMVASLNLESYANALPGVQQIAAAVRKLVEESADFKLDEQTVIDFSFAFGKAMAANVANLGQQVGTFGEGMVGLFEWVLRSSREARDFMKETAAWLTRINAAVSPAAKFINPSLLVGDLMNYARALEQDQLRTRQPGMDISREQIPPPVPGMSADRVREEWRAQAGFIDALSREVERQRADPRIGTGQFPTSDRLFRENQALLGRLRAQQEAYVAGFDMDPTVARAALNRGDVPTIRTGPAAPRADDFVAQLRQGLDAVRGPLAAMRSWSADRIVADLDAAHRRAIGALNDRTAAERAATEAARQQLAARTAAIGPAAVLSAPADPIADRRAAMYAALGGPAGLFRVEPPPIPPDIESLRGDLRRQYDPRRDLSAYRAQLDQIQSRGLLGANTDAFVTRAWRDRLTEVAGKLGIDNGRYQLPEATAVGSAEDARIITAWRTQGAQPTSEQLWQRIALAVEAMLELERNRDRKPLPVAPMPRVVQLPGE